MTDPGDFFWWRQWWAYDARSRIATYHVYHYFNLFEAGCWFLCSAAVLWRFVRHRHSALEALYALAFFTFGLTDIIEAWRLTSWLIWLKLANLIALIYLRRLVRRRWYPQSKLL